LNSDLPSGPSGNSGGFEGGFNNRRPGRFADGGSGGAGGGSASGPITIDQSRLPTSAPYTAFIGNLPFDVAEGDIRTFFQMRNIAAGSILNVKLPRDIVENKSRGFGYVEFSTCEDLTRALLVSNQFSIRNRVVRVDLSDSKPQNDREARPAETNRNWRDGATAGAPISASRGLSSGREDRPVSAAESCRNWRDNAKPTTLQVSSASGSSGFSAVKSEAVSVSNVPAGNWRDSAKPVERTSTTATAAPPAAVKQEKFASQKAAEKVPTGTWRRSEQ
jgi:RNA recognition motif-containing protein